MPLVANWIWGFGDPAPRNTHMQFRREFILAAEPAAVPIRLHISADSRYILYVNGVRLGFGPARNYHYHYEYDSYDLAAQLVTGLNVIAAHVLHWGEGNFFQMVGRGGLLAQLDVEGQPRLVSDETWKAKASAAYEQAVPRIACQSVWEEQVDARLADEGWTTAGFDDRAWEPARVIGPAGTAPWGELSPRSIPFLTDEPVTPLRARALGRMQRPEVVAAVHAGPYLMPGDLTANRHVLDGLIATTLRVPHSGPVRLKQVSIAGGDPPSGDVFRVLLDGQRIDWQLADIDYDARFDLEAGDHAILIDWNGRCHDMDVTLTASGMPGLAMISPVPGDAGRWIIANKPGEARAAAAAATSPEALLQCGAAWQPVAAIDTPAADIHMDLTASVPLQAPLEAAETPVRLPIRVAPVPAGQAQHYLIDFGRLLIGWIELDIEAPAGTTVDLAGFEAVQDGRRQWARWLNNTLRYVTRDGRQTYTSTLRRGARYLIVAVHGNSGEAVLHNVRLRLSTYPWDIQGAFRCADPRLNQIWEQCAYTLRLCSEDTFTDCPTFEQTFWVGDACYTDVMLHQAVHGDPRLARRCLLLAADSLQRLPIAGAQVPGDWENDLLPNWAWLWAMGCAEFYSLTADESFAHEVYPALAKQARFIEAHRGPAGILELQGFWHLLDWAKMPREPDDILSHESCLGVAALNATALVARAAGQPAEAEHWSAVAAELAEAVNRECWRADAQAYADKWLPNAPGENISQPTNIVALLAGVAAGERAAAILPNLLDAPEGWVPSGSPWMHSIGCMLLAERGQMEPGLNSIRAQWGGMLDRGSLTTWEVFPGLEVLDGWWSRSWCHAWSALPAYLMQAFVLGVRPLEPGFKKALIAPQLADLTWAEGKVPTPHGPIAVRVERAGAGLLVQVTLPEGAAAEVRLPAGKETPAVTGGIARIRRVKDEYVIELAPGAQATISSAR
jgi:alpha-L-rhamnosidase